MRIEFAHINKRPFVSDFDKKENAQMKENSIFVLKVVLEYQCSQSSGTVKKLILSDRTFVVL